MNTSENIREQIDGLNSIIAETRAALEKRSADLSSVKDQGALEILKTDTERALKEIDRLTKYRDGLIEMRSAIAAGGDFRPARGIDKRSALVSVINSVNRGVRVDRGSDEARALGITIGTTATTSVTASTSVDGQNNFGVMIPTKTAFDLLNESRPLTPILRDAYAGVDYSGASKWIYRDSRSKAQKKVEMKKVDDAVWDFKTLEGKFGVLETIVKFTDEIVMQSRDIDVGEYVYNQLFQDFNEDFSNQLIYGNGTAAVPGTTAGQVSGISNGATSITVKDTTITTDLLAAVGKLTSKNATGAKIYVSRNVWLTLAAAKDGSGRFLFNPFSATVTIPGVIGLPIEVDDTLNDGGILIGNVTRNYKWSILQGIMIEPSRDAYAKVTGYVASAGAFGAPVPGAFLYGTMTSGE